MGSYIKQDLATHHFFNDLNIVVTLLLRIDKENIVMVIYLNQRINKRSSRNTLTVYKQKEVTIHAQPANFFLP